LSKQMAMQSNCNGSLTKSESQKNNEISRCGAEREFENFNSHFLPPRQVVEPQARTDSYNFYVSASHVIENFL
jgi:hypothetical protein